MKFRPVNPSRRRQLAGHEFLVRNRIEGCAMTVAFGMAFVADLLEG